MASEPKALRASRAPRKTATPEAAVAPAQATPPKSTPPMQVRRPVRRSRANTPYVLDDQVGFILRQVGQRHAAIFAARIGDDLTMTQWAALAKLAETGPCSQNLLGLLTAMDAATIKGVVDRLAGRGLVITADDPLDRRRRAVALTDIGRATADRAAEVAQKIAEETLEPLTPDERTRLISLLHKIC